MTRMRAAENGVDVIHGAVTGASVVITNGGELGEQSDLFEDAVIEGVVRMRTQGPTLYTRWGDWLAVAAMVAAAYAAMVQIMQDIPPVSRDRDKPLETS
jgi:apolipoprotein N-acyltransferase